MRTGAQDRAVSPASGERRLERSLLVTGGSRGIGAATCLKAARAGYAVAVNFRKDRGAADTVVRTIEAEGGRAVAVQGDVAEEADVVAMFDRAAEALGPLHALVNSAGVGGSAAVAEFDAATLERMMRVNVVGLMLCCREAAQRMARSRGGRGGAIVNVSSMAGTIGGRPGASHYAASKAAVDAFTMGFAREVATEGIRVNALRPGVTLTDMTATVRDDPEIRASVEATIAMNRTAEAEEMAAPIVWLLSDEASFISGARLDASGGGFVIGGKTRR